MTDQTEPAAKANKHAPLPGSTPENPTQAELQDSLEQAEFPQAAHMAKEIFGERPAQSDQEN